MCATISQPRPAAMLGMLRVPLVVTLCVLVACAAAQAQDSDADTIPDRYELRFGLDPANPADAGLDPDRDMLLNSEEAALGTDPFSADSDRDGVCDLDDDDPLSRAHADWGNPRFTEGLTFLYPGPSWWLGGYRVGGAWVFSDPTSFVSCEAGNGAYMLVDADLLGSNLTLRVDFLDEAGSSLFVDLVDASGALVAEDLFGNLVQGSGELLSLDLPVGIPPNAPQLIAIGLRTGDGLMAVYESLLYVDRATAETTAEQQDAPATRLCGALPRGVSSGAAGVESRGQPEADASGGRLDSAQDAQRPGTGHPQSTARTIYVDKKTGSDAFSGRVPARGAGNAGPKRTIRAGLRAAGKGWTVRVAQGTYNENVRVNGVKLKTQGRVVIR